MLNTNGIRIAKDIELVKDLAKLKPGFEVYLQFDSLKKSALMGIRGQDMRNIRLQALDNLEKYGISTTLVCAIRKGENDDEVGDIINFAQQYQCVRGITFQPIQDAGRNENDTKDSRITLSEIRSSIIEADNPFKDQDMIPLPCHPEHISIGYAFKNNNKMIPVTGMLPKEVLLKGTTNTIAFEKNPAMKKAFLELFSLDACSEKTTEQLQTLLCCLPKIDTQELSYEHVFRIVIMSFMDQYDFDIGSIKRSCTHFVEPNGKIYPFDTYNLFYRDKIKS